jgi:spore coat protein U-like protein
MALLRASIIAVLLLAAVGRGHAANLAVSAYITSWGYCSVINTQNIAFGNLNPLAPADVQATGNVRVRCFGFNNNFTVGVTQVTPSPLLLTNGPNSIPYTLDLPTSTSLPLYIVGSITIPITAHIRGTDYRLASAGSYTDTVTVQVTP